MALRIGMVVAVLPLVCSLSGCFFYDSRWGQREEEQRRTAESLRPAKLERAPGDATAARVLTVRAYATRGYTAETLHWERRFEELLADASAVLSPIGLRLTNGGTTLWEPEANGERMKDLVAELENTDTGEGAGWVVGFVESAPRLITDFHQLGVGNLFGKHLIVRASNDPAEFQAITAGLDELDDREKARLYAERKHHKTVTVFLHELGHTLGAEHRTDTTSIMSPVYDPKEAGFDETTLGLMKVTLPARSTPAPTPEDYGALLAYYRAHSDGWVERERDAFVQSLERTATRVPAPAAAFAVASDPSQVAVVAAPAARTLRGLAQLSPAERERYDRALQAEAAGEVRGAWRALLPVVETQPDVLEVQELRCRLAQKQGYGAMILEAHCAPFAELRALAEGAAGP